MKIKYIKTSHSELVWNTQSSRSILGQQNNNNPKKVSVENSVAGFLDDFTAFL